METQPQAVTDYTNNHTSFLVWKFKPGNDVSDAFKKICSLVENLNNSAAVRFPNQHVSCVLGIGYDAWLRLSLPTPLPKELKNFTPVAGEKYTAVATPADLHFHLRGHDTSICYDMAAQIAAVLHPVADCVEEIHGFKYWDGRSILGFVDGTENPKGRRRAYFSLVGDEDAAYNGGSYLFVQKYMHRLSEWKNLPLQEQENVIGRSKHDDIELPKDVKPANSHSALANAGDDKKIVRDNVPFGKIANNDMGTYFIAYASSFATVEEMLRRMYIGVPAGNYDRILDYSTPQTGSLFFVPTVDMLSSFAG